MPKPSLLSRPAVKKLLLFYLIAMLLVLVLFVLRTLFYEEKEMEYLEFNTRSQAAIAEQNSSEPAIADKKFMLLPTR